MQLPSGRAAQMFGVMVLPLWHMEFLRLSSVSQILVRSALQRVQRLVNAIAVEFGPWNIGAPQFSHTSRIAGGLWSPSGQYLL